jgi:hypothetical protein
VTEGVPETVCVTVTEGVPETVCVTVTEDVGVAVNVEIEELEELDVSVEEPIGDSETLWVISADEDGLSELTGEADNVGSTLRV